MSALCLRHILRGLMEIWRENRARKRYFMMEELLQELAMDSDSDKELEKGDFFFWPDGDDFVTKGSTEA